MPPKKSAAAQKKEKPVGQKTTAKKKTKKAKISSLNESLSIPPIIAVEELIVPIPQTRTWFSVLHDDRVYKTTTTILNRVVLVSSIAVYIIAFVLAGMSTFAEGVAPTGPSPEGVQLLKNAANSAGLSGQGGETAHIGTVIAKFIQFFFGALGLAFICYIFYAGFVWLTAAGEEDKVKKARGMIFHSILGLIICAASFAVASAWLSGIGDFVAP